MKNNYIELIDSERQVTWVDYNVLVTTVNLLIAEYISAKKKESEILTEIDRLNAAIRALTKMKNEQDWNRLTVQTSNKVEVEEIDYEDDIPVGTLKDFSPTKLLRKDLRGWVMVDKKSHPEWEKVGRSGE